MITFVTVNAHYKMSLQLNRQKYFLGESFVEKGLVPLMHVKLKV